ncbi:MAG: archaeal flagellar protein FlaJ [Thermoproteota archaeon]|nr:archaeal flagellar protein FlaJ [Thermoproteota archaeon]
MGKIPYETRRTVAVISTIAVVGIIISLISILKGAIILFLNEFLLIGTLVIITPSAILDIINQRWLTSIEGQMTVLVRGLAESQEIGISIEGAFVNVVENKLIHGPLADEVKKINVQLSWGMSLDEALEEFRERVKSPIVNRFCVLVLEASRSGGLIRKVFTATSGFMQEMREMDRETSSQMRPYVIVVYAAFLVFIITSVILLKSFFEPLQGMPQIIGTSSLPSVSEYKDFFYRTTILTGVMGGLMAGKISELRVMGGLKHAIAQVIIGYMVMVIFVPPNWVI